MPRQEIDANVNRPDLTTGYLTAGYKRFSLYAGYVTLIIGLLAFGAAGLGSTALAWLDSVNGTAFTLAGVAILALSLQSRWAKILAYVAGALLVTFAIAEIWSFAFDSASSGVFSDNQALGFVTSTFGVMPATDAMGFLLIALALLTIDFRSKSQVRLAELFGVAALLGALMTLIGVLFGVPNFCILISCLRISPYAAAAFIVPCLAVLTVRIDRGLLAVMASPTAGGVMARRLLPAAIVIPIVLGGLKMMVQSAHMVDAEVALTMAMLAMIVVYLTLLWSNAILLDRTDAERMAAAKSLEQSEQRIRAIVQQASDAFVAIDRSGIIRHWNESASKLFGIKEEDAVGKRLADLVTVLSLPGEIEGIFDQCAKSGEASGKPVEMVLSVADGHEVPAEVAAFPVVALGEQIVCAFVRDITERKAIEARFRDFYFTVSHELRSPLTSVMGNMTLAQRDKATKLSERAGELLDAAGESCQRLIKLINDLLDVKRIEVGKFKVVVEPVDPIEVASLAVANLQGSATMHAVEIETVIEATNTIDGDLERLVQVLTNFLSNAIKFSPAKGAIRIAVTDTENGGVRFSVTDNGAGITQELLPRLFGKFEQGPLMPSFKQVGSGLGLSISKTIVEEHGGTIGAQNNNGSGATFWFEIPPAKTPVASKL